MTVAIRFPGQSRASKPTAPEENRAEATLTQIIPDTEWHSVLGTTFEYLGLRFIALGSPVARCQ